MNHLQLASKLLIFMLFANLIGNYMVAVLESENCIEKLLSFLIPLKSENTRKTNTDNDEGNYSFDRSSQGVKWTPYRNNPMDKWRLALVEI